MAWPSMNNDAVIYCLMTWLLSLFVPISNGLHNLNVKSLSRLVFPPIELCMLILLINKQDGFPLFFVCRTTYFIVTGPPTCRVGGQTSNGRWLLLSSSVTFAYAT